MKQPILITPGEPAGIGPDVVIQAARQSWSTPCVVVADPDLLKQRARALKIDLELKEYNGDESLTCTPNQLYILPVRLNTPVTAGVLNPAHAAYVIECLKVAAELCLQSKARGLVTGPVHKANINRGGIAFQGHTEFLAEVCKVKRTVMLFVIDQLKVALTTTHLPLAAVPQAITKALLRETITILKKDLQRYFQITDPKLFICGLNPHAGEEGLLGREEIDIMTPTLQQLNNEGYHLIGPLPADTIFTPQYLNQADAILAMYHDQALPLIKHLGFERAVNMTLGLPFLRTSVDHGTALGLAGTGNAHPGSFIAALKLADVICESKLTSSAD